MYLNSDVMADSEHMLESVRVCFMCVMFTTCECLVFIREGGLTRGHSVNMLSTI